MEAKKLIEQVKAGADPSSVLQEAEKDKSGQLNLKKHRAVLLGVARTAVNIMASDGEFSDAVDRCIEEAINKDEKSLLSAGIDLDDEDVFAKVHEAVADLSFPPLPTK